MNCEVTISIRHRRPTRHLVKAHNSHSAAAMLFQRLPSGIDRLHDVRIISVIGMPTGTINRAFHDQSHHTNRPTR